MESFQTDITSLVSQLEKLMKVINHSDPSAQDLKHLLHRKYQQNIAAVADQIKGRFLFEDIKEYIQTLFRNHVFEIDDGTVREKILKKILIDFEEEFISRPQWQEFSEPDPAQVKERIKHREQKKAQKQQNDASVKMSYRQRHAKGELQKVIDAINRLDPKKLEKKITKITGGNKPN